MNTCVALVGAYLRFNGYITVPEQPVLIGQGKPYRYHTATDVDILAVRFPNAAIVVPREYGAVEDDLHLDIDPLLALQEDTVDVLIAEVKSGRPRLNEGLRDQDVLYATLRRVDPGFDVDIRETIDRLIRHGEANAKSAGKKWRFRLVAFGEGQPAPDGGPYMVIQLRHVAKFLTQTMREHHQVWKDAQFGDSVLDLLHLFDKMGFVWSLGRDEEDEAEGAHAVETVASAVKQNEKAASTRARPATAARKNKSAPSGGTARKPNISNDGWIPGGG